jgi:MoxR-like ATPase
MSALTDLNALQANIAESVLGQDQVIRQILLGLLANGHLLLESLPGLAKTRTVKALSKHLDAKMSRIQFTPDLLPSDITGAEVLHQVEGRNEIRFQPGPLFGNLILADEINRAPAKVQAALLEAMEERQITVAGNSHPLPELFIVVATQNPIEQEGTYPLPDAQMDRFLMKVLLDYPSAENESQVLRLLRDEEFTKGSNTASKNNFALSQDVIFAARREVSAIHVSPAIDRYLIDLINSTRYPADYDEDLGGIGLDRCARADAWLQGQDFVSPDNVRAVVHPVLRHRIQLSYDAVADGVTADQVLDRILDKVAIPA